MAGRRIKGRFLKGKLMKRIGMLYQNSVLVNGWQWFWSENCNALYKRNLQTGETERVGAYESCENAAYTKLVPYESKLIALPYAADRIMIYDMGKMEFRYSDIGIPDINAKNVNSEKFYGYVVRENWLFMIGCKTAHVLKFDMAAEQAVEYVDLQGQLPKINKGIGYLREGGLYGNQIFIPALYENCVFVLDADSMRYSAKRFNKGGKGFSAICIIGSQIWLFPFDDEEIIQWDCKNETVVKHNIKGLACLKKGSRNFLSAHLIGRKLWMLPRFADKVLAYDFDAGKFSDENEINSFFANSGKKLVGISAERVEDGILFLTSESESVIVLNTEKDEISLVDNDILENDILNMIWRKEKKLMVSEKDFQLENFLRFLCEL